MAEPLARHLALALVLLVPLACSDDEVAPLVVGDLPSSYRITYVVEDGDDISSEVLTVVRPFDSRIETFASEDGRGQPTGVEVTTFGRSSRAAGSGGRLAVAIPPGIAPGDARVEDLLGTEVLERAGRKTIAGRDCQVFRTGQSLRLVELVVGDDVEVCVDAAGLVLEERTNDRSRTAIDVEVGVRASFDVGERTIPVLNGGGAVQELTVDSRPPTAFWELGDDLPLPVLGRYAVVPPQPDTFSDATLRGRRVATTTDVLTEGIDVVMVDRGGSLEGVDVVVESEDAERVEVGDLGEGALVETSTGPEITVVLDGGRFVRVRGTLSSAALIAVARGLHEVDGGELSPIGEQW